LKYQNDLFVIDLLSKCIKFAIETYQNDIFWYAINDLGRNKHEED